MPTYEYHCKKCGPFQAVRPMRLRNDDSVCPNCGKKSIRVPVAAPALSIMSSYSHAAHAINERAANAPKTSSEQLSSCHTPDTGCCNSSASKSTVRTPDGAKIFPNNRPWMISH